MQFLLDNISATIVAMLVLVTLLFVQHYGWGTAVDNTTYYSAKTQLYSLVVAVERDFANIGSGVPAAEPRIIAFSDDSLTFRAKRSFDGPTETITYRRSIADTVQIDGESTVLYRVDRIVDGVLEGASTGTLRKFEIKLFDAQNQPVSSLNLASARSVNVSVIATFPVSEDRFLKETRWASSFAPPRLAR